MAAEAVPAGAEEQPAVVELSGDVGTKYRAAADVVQKTLEAITTSQIAAGMKVVDICTLGDKLIEGQCAAQFKSKKIEKGVAFPTCISVNNITCHFSPLSECEVALAEGDLVKIDCAAHFDGFVAAGAHTMVVPAEAGATAASPSEEVTKVTVAAYEAAHIAARMIKAGAKNTAVTEAMGRVAEAYGVTPVQGTLMHQMKQYIIDGNKVILLRGDDPEQKADEEEFATHDVFAVDVAFSTGAGKPKASSARTTVFKRAHENHFGLKMKASKWLLGNVMSKSPYMPFTLRAFGDERQARLGVTECVNHDVFYEYPVLEEEEGKVVAQFKFTVLVTPSGPQIVTGLPLPEGMAVEGVSLPEDLAAIRAEELHTSGGGKKKRRRKKKGGAKAAEAAEE